MSIFSNINEDNERQSQNPDIPQGQNIPYNQGTQDEEEPLDEEDLDDDEVFDDDLDDEEEWEEYEDLEIDALTGQRKKVKKRRRKTTSTKRRTTSRKRKYKKSKIPGLSYRFSWKEFFGITWLKRWFSRKTGIPTTKQGRRNKLGRIILGWLGLSTDKRKKNKK